MVHNDIHLIWLGEPSTVATDAVTHWHKQGNGRNVVVYNDGSLLLPELQPIWDEYTSPVMRSDLLRWSILLTQGGWYFDCDVRCRKTLDEVEQECNLSPDKCFITFFTGSPSPPTANILACRPNWCGRKAIIDAILQSADEQRPHLSPWFNSQAIWTVFQKHPDWFTYGDLNTYSALSAEVFHHYREQPRPPIAAGPLLPIETGTEGGLQTVSAEELARRQAICMACEDWDAAAGGCQLIDKRERRRLTRHKQQYGRCARCCSGRSEKW